MCLDDTVRIPLRARDGSVRAYALIDAADADFVNQWRWGINTNGYVQRTQCEGAERFSVMLHRALLGLVRGDDRFGDHINRIRLDNRRSNLRVLDKRTNPQNQSSNRGSSSTFRGVTWCKRSRKWVAQVQVDGRGIYLGSFHDEEAAGNAAREGRKRLLAHAVD